jgi:hypothetical protein
MFSFNTYFIMLYPWIVICNNVGFRSYDKSLIIIVVRSAAWKHTNCVSGLLRRFAHCILHNIIKRPEWFTYSLYHTLARIKFKVLPSFLLPSLISVFFSSLTFFLSQTLRLRTVDCSQYCALSFIVSCF